MPESFLVNIDTPMIGLNCGDGRESDELAAKLLGARLALAWDAMVLEELVTPGSVQRTLLETDKQFTEEGLYQNAEIDGQVHSDEHCEGKGATEIDITRKEGKIGCGRWQEALAIARAALENIDKFIEEIKEEAPTVIEGNEEDARKIARANVDLAERTLEDGRPVLASGREVVTGAMENGARGKVLKGDHEEELAEYSLRDNTTHDNRKAQDRFHIDGWLELKFFGKNTDKLPYDPRLVLLQSVIISKATRLVLDGKSTVDEVIS